MAKYKVEHVSKRRFELQNQEGKTVGYMDYHEGVGSLHFDFVYVDPSYRGEKVGVEIVKEGIKMAKERKLKPQPICSYAAIIMRRNKWPEEFVG
ncbi:GNAT family N-acetyltransferase [Flavobacteriaceae bacterium Ap0902]|nr:GNAT family N-acetyltransferase [Flavobacteriaceae bacterium Ap0902]